MEQNEKDWEKTVLKLKTNVQDINREIESSNIEKEQMQK